MTRVMTATTATAYAIITGPGLWIGSPISTETSNPNMAATWPRLQDAQRVAFVLGGEVVPVGTPNPAPAK